MITTNCYSIFDRCSIIHLMARPQAIPFLVAALALFATAGCKQQEGPDLRAQVKVLQEKVEKQNSELAARQAAIDELNHQLAIARGISDDDLKKIFYPEKLVIGTLSGGYNDNGKAGDDGVSVYLQPVDKKGDVIKAAGDIRIELYDLANPASQNQVGVYVFTVEQAAEHWFGQLMTNHYSLKCPWQHGPPKHSEITIRAQFTDYLTKRIMNTQATVKVKVPGGE